MTSHGVGLGGGRILIGPPHTKRYASITPEPQKGQKLNDSAKIFRSLQPFLNHDSFWKGLPYSICPEIPFSLDYSLATPNLTPILNVTLSLTHPSKFESGELGDYTNTTFMLPPSDTNAAVYDKEGDDVF